MRLPTDLMRLPIDLLSGIYTKPNFYLCETNKEKICKLETTDARGSFKFNSMSELSFETARVYNDLITGETVINPFFDKIEALRLILVEGFGYFELQGPKLISNGIEEKKSCTAYSLEYTLSQKYLEDFYVNMGTLNSAEVDEDGNVTAPIQLFHPTDKTHSLLDLAIEKIYGWEIGHVDPQLCTLTRQFEVDRESVYDFLMNEVCEKFNCYIVFDTINNKINVYSESPTKTYTNCDGKTNTFTNGDPENGIAPFSTIETVAVDGYKTTKWTYGIVDGVGILVLEDAPLAGETVEVIGVDSTWETDVFVSFDNLSQEINVDYDADSIKTVLTVTFGEDQDIRESNLGLPYLTDLSYYYSVEWMGQKLYDKYTKYLNDCNNSQSDYTKNSKKITEYNDCISYEKNRLSQEYTEVKNVTPTTVGVYYVKTERANGSYYYSEVSLPSEYRTDTKYYSNTSTNLNETIVNNLYTALKNYFYAYFTGNADARNSAINELNDMSDSFKFMKTYTISYLSNALNSATTQNNMDAAVLNFLGEMWSEVGKNQLNNVYLKIYTGHQQRNVEEGLADKNNDNYGMHYPVILIIESINAAIKERDDMIAQYESEKLIYRNANLEISDKLLMDNYFDEDDLIRLNAFLREDELHIDDIVVTSQDDLTSSLKIQQDAKESGRIELKKLCAPKLQFSMTMANIYALPEFEKIVDQFQLGNIIRIKLRDMQSHQFRLIGDGISTEYAAPLSFEGVKKISFSDKKKIKYNYDSKAGKIIFDTAPVSGVVIDVVLANYYIKQSRLLQVDINFDDFSDFSCVFGELTGLRTQSDIHADLLSQAITAGKSVATNSSYWTKGSNAATSIDAKIQQGLLDATTQIKAMDGTQGVVIDKYGIKLQKIDPLTGAIDPHQTWLVNNMILMSDDGFKTSRSALGQVTVGGKSYYGLIADIVLSGYIEGSEIVGGTIKIGDLGNGKWSFEVDKDGNVSMLGGKVKFSNELNSLEEAVVATEATITKTADEIRGEVSSTKTDLEGQISETNSLISQTATEIRSEVNSKETALDGKISETNSLISQTATEIRSEVSSTNTELNGLKSRVDTAEQKITADAIVSTVTSSQTYKDLDSSVSNLSSRVNTAEQKITSDAIVSTVTSSQTYKDLSGSVSNLTNRMNTAEQKITADAIVSTVTSSDTYKNTLNSKANQSDMTNLSSRVSTAEQKITAEAIVNTVTSSNTYKDLTSRVSTAEQKITSDAIVSTVTSSQTYKDLDSSVSNLSSRVNTAEQKITSDAIVSTVTSSQTYKDLSGSVSNLTNRMNTAEQKITADAIVSTVTSSDTYKNTLNSKANQSDMTNLSSRVSTAEQKITAEAIVNTVTSSNTYKDLTSRVSTAEQKITSDAIVSTVTSSQTYKDLSGKVDTNSSNITGLGNRVTSAEQKITSDAIVNTVTSSQTYKNNLNSKANQSDLTNLTNRVTTAEQKITADAIVSTVRSNSNYQSDLNSKANNSDLTNLTGRVTSAEQKITSDAIVSTVTSSDTYKNNLNSKVSSSQIISTINQTSESVSISANKINFNGLVTANNYFKILTDGSMEASAGKIGGWTLGSDGRLYAEADIYIPPGEKEYKMIMNHHTGVSDIPSDRLYLYDLNGDGEVDYLDGIAAWRCATGVEKYSQQKGAIPSRVTITLNPNNFAKTFCISGTNIWDGDTEIFLGSDMGNSLIATKDFVNLRIDEASTMDNIYSGNLSSGQATFSDSEDYNFYIVQGKPASSNSSLCSMSIPRELIISGGSQWLLCDESYYMSFTMSSSSNKITLNIISNNRSGVIYNIYGVR